MNTIINWKSGLSRQNISTKYNILAADLGL